MTNRYKPWPVGTYDLYQKILKHQNTIEAMVKVCIQEGVEEKNKEIIKRLSRLIYIRAGQVQACCKEILSHLPEKRTGRGPKWYTTTLDIQAKAMSISDLIGDINQALRGNELIYIGSLLKCINTETDGIGKLLQEAPNTGNLEIWEEALDEAFKGDL